jgi:ABC-2 type transport system ATP-binding protein
MDYVIDVKKLNKCFGKKRVVCDVDMKVKKGEIFGFLGPNGSGKTTMLRMICGLLHPTSGSGHCLGYDIVKDSLSIKKQVGYMTQRFSLYEDLTVRENMDFYGRIYQMENRSDRINLMLKDMDFSSRSDQLAGDMSGGWKQRLALACCLLHEPKVLLLDEPTAGVDPKARRDFWDIIHEFAGRGITTLVTTHYMDEAERCTRLAYIAYGKLLAEGVMSDIIKNSGLFAWSVAGEGASAIIEDLKVTSGISQVAIFGNKLHVCGPDQQALAAAIEPYKRSGFHWEEMAPTIEDVFINLVDGVEDNF